MSNSGYNWNELLATARVALLEQEVKPSWRKLAKYLGVPRQTLQEGFARNFGIVGNVTAIVAELSSKERVFGNVSQSVNDDEIVAEAKSDRIITLEQLIETCNIDLDVWDIERWEANKWEVGAKDANDNLVVKPLFQIKAWLRKKTFDIKFVSVSISPTQTPSPKYERDPNFHKALIIPDVHFGFNRNLHTGEMTPYHDRRALHAALQIATLANPDRIIYLGDNLDFAEFSLRFARTPETYWTTQAAIKEAAWWMTQFHLAAPDAEEDYLEGNHEERLLRALSELLPVAYKLQSAKGEDLLTIPRMLGLDELGIRYHDNYPNDEVWLNPNVRCIHGSVARAKSGATALAMIEGAVFTTIFGHVHKTELVSQTIRYGKESRSIYGFCPGTLSRIDGTVPGSDVRSQWQQGIGLVYYNNDYHNILSVSIQNGRAIYGGMEIIGEDLTEQIEAEALTPS